MHLGIIICTFSELSNINFKEEKTSLLNSTILRLLHIENAKSPISSTEDEIDIHFKDVSLKACLPIIFKCELFEKKAF